MSDARLEPKTALIVGAGAGLSASLARAFHARGVRVGVAARDTAKLEAQREVLGVEPFSCDASRANEVEALFERVDNALGEIDVVVYNPSYRVRGPIAELDPAEVEKAIAISAFGGFLVGQQAAIRMQKQGRGAILFTGASASVKGYARSASFAMGKFALRGLAQSMARELQPKNIHVAHFVIDGGIASAERDRLPPKDNPDCFLDPDAIAESYLAVIDQHRSAWSWEVELRPWVEKF